MLFCPHVLFELLAPHDFVPRLLSALRTLADLPLALFHVLLESCLVFRGTLEFGLALCEVLINTGLEPV